MGEELAQLRLLPQEHQQGGSTLQILGNVVMVGFPPPGPLAEIFWGQIVTASPSASAQEASLNILLLLLTFLPVGWL